jgi:N-acetylhexosamine 1-kinase
LLLSDQFELMDKSAFSLFRLGEIFNLFEVEEPALFFEPYGLGLIHLSYRVFTDNHCYVLQKLNTRVFPFPAHIECNLMQLIQGDPYFHCIPKIYCTREGRPLLYHKEGVFKLSSYVPNAMQNYGVLTAYAMEQAAWGVCQFYKTYAHLNGDKLATVISDFHHLGRRWEKLEKVMEITFDKIGEDDRILFEELVNWKRQIIDLQVLLDQGSIPWRVSHNDVKLDNILLDKDSGAFLKIIDLDTVMKGSFLFDFGDLCRSILPSQAENQLPDDQFQISIPNFKAICQGFKPLEPFLMPEEKRLLVPSIQYITLLMALRFYTDHLEGNVYFKCEFPEQNRVRTLNQLRLLKELASTSDTLGQIANAYFS